MESLQVTVADRVDVKSVLAALQIGKSLFYGTYTKDCRITPTRIGNQSYILGSEFELLQAYHLARAAGKAESAEFLEKLFAYSEDEQLQNQKSPIDKMLALSKDFVLSTIYQKLSMRLKLLEEYASSPHARLSTIELSQALELSPSTLYGHKEYSRLGFTFRRDRQGWQVLIPANDTITTLSK
ncbi:DNA-binding transcriptional regulator, MarR family [Nostoc flagelliforme CCNUN1]|uniref:DNA-binding transcriptional regulator, MarR family n=1 Tax=Nostoc flagelliforme CCNUN1 TaxID=2038116 RepID=A0A2K8SPV1_9NOSO|nr:hypothetical protein [Nostoc flagelliforme]AUB37467.1 DNA-binding transcriptional regulator, MarR family [Nostoc flagelliforme CCNUN1]